MRSDGTDAPLLGEPLPIELANTFWADRWGSHDALDDGPGVLAWLSAARPATMATDEPLDRWMAAAGPQELARLGTRLRQVRDAVRRLAAHQTGDPRVHAASPAAGLTEAVNLLDRAAAAAPHWSRLEWPSPGSPMRSTRTEADPGTAVTASLAESAIDFFSGEVRHELRACLAPHCVLYFVRQHPRREWCTVACGNRARAARHYRRHRRPASGPRVASETSQAVRTSEVSGR